MPQPRFRHPSKVESREQISMPDYQCWSCGQAVNQHCGPENPQTGEVLVCLNCTDPAVWGVDGLLRQPRPDEHAGIIADPEYRNFVAVIRAANRQALIREQAEARDQEALTHGET
jgi:DNA-directed RNA polymerase subunit RPC12/RpoP